jgi:hypothetical protein
MLHTSFTQFSDSTLYNVYNSGNVVEDRKKLRKHVIQFRNLAAWSLLHFQEEGAVS